MVVAGNPRLMFGVAAVTLLVLRTVFDEREMPVCSKLETLELLMCVSIIK